MLSDEQVTSDRWARRLRKGIGGGRGWGGSGLADTPIVGWKMSAGGSRGHLLGGGGGVSARKLAASLWRLVAASNDGGSVRWQFGLFDGLGFKFCASFPIPKFAMEGATKWDYCRSKRLNDASYFCTGVNLKKSKETATTIVASRQAAPFKAQKRVNELKAEGGSRKEISHYMKKLKEERASGMITEHRKMRSTVKSIVDDIKRERKKCKQMDIANSKLLSDIAKTKSSAREFSRNLEKEKKARELLENVCDKLAKEVESKKAEIAALRNQRARIQEEVEKERKMLQMAEVLREEHAQMKLVDAKLILEDKYAEMNNLIEDFEAFLRPSNSRRDLKAMSKDRDSRQAPDPMYIPVIKESSSDGMFAIIKDYQTGEAEGRYTADHCFSHDQANYVSKVHFINPEVNDVAGKSKLTNGSTGCGSGFKGTSGKETVTQDEIHPGRTLGGSEGSVNRVRSSNYTSNCDAGCSKNAIDVSRRSQSSGISSKSFKQSKKKNSSVCKLQRTLPRKQGTCKTIPSNGSGRISNGSVSSIVSPASPQRVSGKEALNNHNSVSPWRSTEWRNPHVFRAMKGYIAWPRVIQRHRSGANLLSAKLESQKTMMRNVLKQRS